MKILKAILLIPIITIFEGFILQTLWNWFIPTIFTGLPKLTLPHSIAIFLIIKLVRGGSPSTNREDDIEGLIRLLPYIIFCLIVLLMGFILKNYF